MHAENQSTGHNRTIRFTDLPGYPHEMNVAVNYTSENLHVEDKAVTLDSIIIPEILRAVNHEPEACINLTNLTHDTETVAQVTIQKDGKTARVWLGLKFNNRGQVVATLTAQTKTGETIKTATAPWQS